MNSSHPQFSVIVPLQNDRDAGPACVASWLAQTISQDAYEIVLVASNPHGKWEQQLRTRLRPCDQFVAAPDGAETLFWEHGARQARGAWLLFSEAHCVADRRCLEEMSRYLQDHEVAGACCQSIGIARSPAARIDERLFQQGFQSAIDPDNWRKLVMHGSVVRKSVYFELGGFDVRHGRFAEWVLERRLHDAGHRLGYAPHAIVRHLFRDSLAELIPELVGYTDGECAFQADQPQLPIADYTCFPPEWRMGHEPNTRLARAVAGAVACSFWSDLRLGMSSWNAFHALRTTLQRTGLLGRRFRAAAAWTAMQWAFFQAWRRRSDETALEPAYRRLKEAIVRWARYRFLAQHEATDRCLTLTPGHCDMADIADDALLGFHCLEKSPHGVFRWTRAVAGIEFQLTPGDYQLVLHTGGLRGHVRPLVQDVLFNGIRIPLDQLADDACDPIIPLRARNFEPEQPQRLVLISEPENADRLGAADRRELGLPVMGIEVRRAA